MLHHSTSFNTSKTYSLHGDLKLVIDIKKNSYNFSPDALFQMAVRINKKRQFLFVSRLLGKHLAVDPAISLGTGTILASMLMEDEGLEGHPLVKELVEMINSEKPNRKLSMDSLKFKATLPNKTVFIGFAETATGLGHAVFQHFENAHYIHTTREEILHMDPSFYFEEEHSHATSHRVYAPEQTLTDAETIVLIDDEITTGLTLSNLIVALNDAFPGKQYKILSILDWRTEAHQQDYIDLMKTHNISSEIITIISGQFTLQNQAIIEEKETPFLNSSQTFSVYADEQLSQEITSKHRSEHATYSTFTGRFGLTSDLHEEMADWIERFINKLPQLQRDKPTLIIGIGENIYFPLRFGLSFGKDTKVQTTTRSPILAKTEESYPIQHKCKFKLPDSNGIDQYLYNLAEIEAEQIIVISESVQDRASWSPLLSYLEKLAPVSWVSLTLPERGDKND
ncbi:phosphoribosyltransferase domain-containing protein [Psychrobacillus sp. NPDC096623]|uniref:phosphoribosyltransferase domain-containing protein n=1 Tax=Psychrobacillus sp. NPDC096623 TaxID=3364492 RepID=UPI003801CC48